MEITFAEEQASYDYDREREDALFFESQPYNSFAAADDEAHYLFLAGYTSYCSCTPCELRADAEAADDYEVYRFDFEATVEEIDQMAADLFASAEAARDRELAPAENPWF